MPCCLTILWVIGCSSGKPAPPAANSDQNTKPQVFVSTLFLRETVLSLAGDAVDLVYPFATTNCLTWQPTIPQTRQLQNADLILLTGANFEPWQAKLSLPRSRIVDASADYSEQLMPIHNVKSHQHGPDGQTEGTETAWATWLDPKFALAQLNVVREALIVLLPQQTDSINAAANARGESLKSLDDTLNTISTETDRITVLVDNPQWCYLVRRLGWKLVPLPKSAPTNTTQKEKDFLAGLMENHKPQFILTTSSAEQIPASSLRASLLNSGMFQLQLDLCLKETDGKLQLVNRMQQNLQRLQLAVESFPAK